MLLRQVDPRDGVKVGLALQSAAAGMSDGDWRKVENSDQQHVVADAGSSLLVRVPAHLSRMIGGCAATTD